MPSAVRVQELSEAGLDDELLIGLDDLVLTVMRPLVGIAPRDLEKALRTCRLVTIADAIEGRR